MPAVSRNKYVKGSEALACPQCDSPTQVTDSRGTERRSIRRRRRCTGCGITFTTLETFVAFDGKQGRTPLTKSKAGDWMDEAKAYAAMIPTTPQPRTE